MAERDDPGQRALDARSQNSLGAGQPGAACAAPLCYGAAMMLLRADAGTRRFARGFVAVAVFTVIVLVCIEAIGVCPLVR